LRDGFRDGTGGVGFGGADASLLDSLTQLNQTPLAQSAPRNSACIRSTQNRFATGPKASVINMLQKGFGILFAPSENLFQRRSLPRLAKGSHCIIPAGQGRRFLGHLQKNSKLGSSRSFHHLPEPSRIASLPLRGGGNVQQPSSHTQWLDRNLPATFHRQAFDQQCQSLFEIVRLAAIERFDVWFEPNFQERCGGPQIGPSQLEHARAFDHRRSRFNP